MFDVTPEEPKAPATCDPIPCSGDLSEACDATVSRPCSGSWANGQGAWMWVSAALEKTHFSLGIVLPTLNQNPSNPCSMLRRYV